MERRNHCFQSRGGRGCKCPEGAGRLPEEQGGGVSGGAGEEQGGPRAGRPLRRAADHPDVRSLRLLQE